MLPSEKAVPVLNRNPAPCEGGRVTFTPPGSTLPLSGWRGLSFACRLILLLLALHALSGAAQTPILIVTPNAANVTVTQNSPAAQVRIVVNVGGVGLGVDYGLASANPVFTTVNNGRPSQPATGLTFTPDPPANDPFGVTGAISVSGNTPAGTYRATWSAGTDAYRRTLSGTPLLVPPGPFQGVSNYITITVRGNGTPLAGVRGISLRLNYGQVEGIWRTNMNIIPSPRAKPPINNTVRITNTLATDRTILRARRAGSSNGGL